MRNQITEMGVFRDLGCSIYRCALYGQATGFLTIAVEKRLMDTNRRRRVQALSGAK